MRKQTKPRRPVEKKPYRTPRLITHGDLRKLALGRGGRRSDGWGKPSSRDYY
jgi:hypothetical protein